MHADSRRWTGEHPRLSAFIGGFKCLKRGNIQLKYRPVLPILGVLLESKFALSQGIRRIVGFLENLGQCCRRSAQRAFKLTEVLKVHFGDRRPAFIGGEI